MKTEMTHDEAFAELDAVAFDLLDTPERDAVLAHVNDCQQCRAELDRRRAVVADLSFAAPLAADSSNGSRKQIRNRLTARAAADIQPRRLTPLVFPTVADMPAVTPNKPRRASLWVGIAASVAFVAAVGVLAIVERDREVLRSSLDAITIANLSSSRVMDSLQAEIAARDSVLRAIGARDVTVLNLTSGSTAPSGRMFWDRARGSWTFLAQNLPPLQPGRTYQLWIVTNKAKISAGTFEPRNGEATVSAQLVLTEPLAAVVVTEEPAGGMLQPTGATVIAVSAR